MPLSLADLTHAVVNDAAVRRRRTLQPVGGPGDTLFPPTYPGEEKNDPPRHVFERRRIGGSDVWCVLIDSVQSQANRMEETLLEAARDTENPIPLPRLTVDFAGAGLETVGEITSLEAPHRVFDAILRDSLLDGTPFKDSPVGQRLALATSRDASAILETSPTSLLFGVWNSTGEGGGLGAKFPRAIVSEIIGVGVSVENTAIRRRDAPPDVQTSNRRTGSRIDPLGILRAVEVYRGANGWDVSEKAAGKGAKKARPSEINHGNIAPSVQALGVTCDRAEQTVVITLAGLRRLRFGGPTERDTAGRTLIAALGLVALLEQDAQGYALRSRCDLVCDGPAPLEIVHADGEVQPVTLTREEARALYAEAVKAAEAAGFTLSPEPVRLTPQDKLVHIVRESMHRALAGEAHPNEGDA
ncbi:type I-G CRISPR-associated RAMP protein Csb1/Cas7g [Roseospira navarrensis]|uniref:Type I-U CRISPR-associated protein Cas7 n=1 Tax=Roseospira navarrensis TaxID=140058 RepID=A0A7X1ZGX7_9PROT|nr:type I-U CRISPR-associated RAMP protein Csb1/Cas7u [Roseospira navarrensis]MQX38255.1 type I-U CRISPR-associated protein Cas7 [Roseospira navarrensis]